MKSSLKKATSFLEEGKGLLSSNKTQRSIKSKSPSSETSIDLEKRVHERLLGDIRFRGILARAIGKDFEERTLISEEDIHRFIDLYSLDPNKLRVEMETKLIPLMKKGYKWESPQSRKLRSKYFRKLSELISLVNLISVENDFQLIENNGFMIEPSFRFEREGIELCGAYGFVDKRPRKHKKSKTSTSILFQEMYLKGKKLSLFAVFDGFGERKIDDESMPSQISLFTLKELINSFKFVRKEKDIFDLFRTFVKKADKKINESANGYCGASATIGVVFGKKVFYLNIGTTRLYGLTKDGYVIRISKDSLIDFFNRGGKLKIKDFLKELEKPMEFLGGFSQTVSGRYAGRRIISEDISLRKDFHFGSADLANLSQLFAVSEGIWRYFGHSMNEEYVNLDEYKEMTSFLSASRSAEDTVSLVYPIIKHRIKSKKLANYFIPDGKKDLGMIAVDV